MQASLITLSRHSLLPDQKLEARHARHVRGFECASAPHGRRGGNRLSKLVVRAGASQNEQEAAGSSEPQGFFSILANTLLRNAASLREPRGVTHCLKCKGLGTMECRACKGSGVVSGSKVQQHNVRRMVDKLEQMVGAASAVYNDESYMVTNRCRRCHGTGRHICPYCHGTGVKGPGAPIPPSKGKAKQPVARK